MGMVKHAMKKLFVRLLKRLTKSLEEEQEANIHSLKISQEDFSDLKIESLSFDAEKYEEKTEQDNKPEKKQKKKGSAELTTLSFDPRDMMEIMEHPFLSLSKNRKTPIHYERETKDGAIKVKVSCHPPYYVASIYDWDIITFAESKIQESINSGSDIPPRTIVIPRHELLKALRKHNGHKQQKDLAASLTRLKTTLIETNIRNEDYRYRGNFGWLDSWEYTERKDIKEIKITLSQWLYDGICKKGALLKLSPEYFNITSGLKKFLYRTARKHVGVQNHNWEISLERLYEKSGSEREFKKFKHDLKKAVLDNDLPSYLLEWIENNGQTSVRFIGIRKETKEMVSQWDDAKPHRNAFYKKNRKSLTYNPEVDGIF